MGTATSALLTKAKQSISFRKWGLFWLQLLTIAALIAVLYGQVLADMAETGGPIPACPRDC